MNTLNVGWNIVEYDDKVVLEWGIINGWMKDKTYRIDDATAELIRSKKTVKIPVMVKKMVSVTEKNDAGEKIKVEKEQEIQETVKDKDGNDIPVEREELEMTVEKALGIEKDKIRKAKEEAEKQRKKGEEKQCKKDEENKARRTKRTRQNKRK